MCLYVCMYDDMVLLCKGGLLLSMHAPFHPPSLSLNSYSSLNPHLSSILPFHLHTPSSLLPPSFLPPSSLLPPPSFLPLSLLHLQNHYVWCWKRQPSPLSPKSPRSQTDTSHPAWPTGTVPEGFEWVLGGQWWHHMIFMYAFHPVCSLSSFVPRPSRCPVFDHLQYAKTEGIEGLVHFSTWMTSVST